MQATPVPASTSITETANDRLKRRSAEWFSRSLIAAVVFHFALFTLWPTMSVAVAGAPRDVHVILELPEIELPPPPEPIARPAAPVAGAVDISDDVTIDPIPFDDWKPERLAPPGKPDTERGEFRAFVPSMVAPRLLNAAEVERELARNYPPLLRDAGIGGTVEVNLWLEVTGGVVKSAIARSSGHAAFDEAALRVVQVMRFAPALNSGQPVRVIVTLPVRFMVQ